MEYGIIGLLVLIADIFAIIQVWKSGTGTAEKLLWTILILALPVIGLIIWYFAGPRGGSAHA